MTKDLLSECTYGRTRVNTSIRSSFTSILFSIILIAQRYGQHLKSLALGEDENEERYLSLSICFSTMANNAKYKFWGRGGFAPLGFDSATVSPVSVSLAYMSGITPWQRISLREEKVKSDPFLGILQRNFRVKQSTRPCAISLQGVVGCRGFAERRRADSY